MTGATEGIAGRGLLALLAYGVPLALIVAPLAGFLVTSLMAVEDGEIVAIYSLDNYVRFFTDPTFPQVFLQTILLCLAVAAIAGLVGYPVAYLFSSLGGRWKYRLLMLTVVPMLMSYVIKIYAMRAILGSKGFLNDALMGLGLLDEPTTLFVFNLNAILLTQSVLLLPFAVLPIFLSLERIPPSLLEASADLGAPAWRRFATVVLPLSLPGLATGLCFVFVLAIGDFLTPQMVGGQSGFTFGRVIFSQFGLAYNWPFGAALSAILACAVVLSIGLAGAVVRSVRVPR
ncbi:MAG: ABC transporter permease [Alphaproteobacteria bacterium]